MRRDRKGFTLIELLVVVAIISLLISILLPSLQGARKQSRQLVCNTNLRSQYQAAYYYSQEHKDWFACGLLGWSADGGTQEYYTYGLSVVKGLGWDDDTKGLWTGAAPSQQRKYRRLMGKIKQLQCPDHPGPLNPSVGPNNPDPELAQPLDYISSAMPIPYDKATVDKDTGDASKPQPDNPQVRGEELKAYTATRKLEHVAAVANPSRLIYITEGSKYLSDIEMRYHHFFLTSQLSAGVEPRVATDQRHPGGLNAAFWDGHVDTNTLKKMDAGWGKSIGERLQLFTVPAGDVPESLWNAH